MLNLSKQMPDRAFKRNPFGATVGLVLSALIVLSSCSSAPSSDDQWLPTSQADETERLVECMQESGWDVELLSEGSYVFNGSPEDQEAYLADSSVCEEQVLNWQEGLSPEQWEDWYEVVQEASDCLEEAGYPVNDRPSLQRFIEMDGFWSPFDQLIPNDDRAAVVLEELEAVCTQPEYWPQG